MSISEHNKWLADTNQQVIAVADSLNATDKQAWLLNSGLREMEKGFEEYGPTLAAQRDMLREMGERHSGLQQNAESITERVAQPFLGKNLSVGDLTDLGATLLGHVVEVGDTLKVLDSDAEGLEQRIAALKTDLTAFRRRVKDCSDKTGNARKVAQSLSTFIKDSRVSN